VTGLTVPAVVLIAALLHATWNAVAHGMKDQLVGFGLLSVGSTACALVVVLINPVPEAAAWPFIITSSLLQVLYLSLLLRAYQLGEFAQMYPLARGTSPFLVVIWTGTVLDQRISGTQLLGVLIISAGLIGLSLAGGLPGRAQVPALAAAVATGVMIAAYTLVDGTGVRHTSTVPGYVAWGFLIQGPVFLAIAFRLRGRGLLVGIGRRTWARGVGGGVVSMLAYGLVVWAQSRGDLATVAALRETSIVFGAVIGAVFFHERFGRYRMLASILVVVGIALLEL
jgi:drug/metabolite transporter (DMT)-like permease